MRGLFLDHKTNTIFAAGIRHIGYDEDVGSALYIVSADGDDIVIPNLFPQQMNRFIRQVFEEGKADFTAYPAFLNGTPY